MRDVTEDKLLGIVRDWLRDHMKPYESQRKFGVATGIKHEQLSVALNKDNEGQVSWRMLALVSELPGMSMGRVFDQLAGRCQALEAAAANDPKPVASGQVLEANAREEAAAAKREIAALRDAGAQAGKQAPARTRSRGK